MTSLGHGVVKVWNGSAWQLATAKPQGLDALMRRYQTELSPWATWLNGSLGAVEEAGIPANADSASWNAAMNWYLNQTDQLGIPVLSWVSGMSVHTDPLGIYTVAPAEWASTTLHVANTQAPTFEMHNTRSVWGTNLVGAAYCANGPKSVLLSNSTAFSNINTGVLGSDYFWPRSGDWSFLASRGVRVVRLHVSWERLQPSLGSSLDAGESGRLLAALSQAASVGIRVLISPYNGHGYAIGASTTNVTYSMPQLDATATVTSTHFADFWSRVSSLCSGNAGLYGYSLCNEPYTLEEGTGLSADIGTGGTFESGQGSWTAVGGATVSVVSSGQRSGAQCLQITAPATPTGPIGIQLSNLSVSAGTKLFSEGYVRSGTKNDVGFSLTLYFMTAANGVGTGTVVGRQGIAQFGRSAAPTLTYGYTAGRTVATAPVFTNAVNLIIQTTSTPAAGDVLYIDDVSLRSATNIYTAAQVWEQISQAAVDAIRLNDATSEVWVDAFGDNDPVGTATAHASGPWVRNQARTGLDPLVRYATHHYADNLTAARFQGHGSGVYTSSYASYLTAAQSAGF